MRPPLTTHTIVKAEASLDYVRVRVKIVDDQNDPIDPTSYGVELAFPREAKDPAGADWKTASWATGESDGPPYRARVAVGPSGDIDLSEGRYGIWIRVTAEDETPVRRVGTLEVL